MSIFIYIYLLWLISDIDPEQYFIRSDVQNILKRITGFNIDKIFRDKKVDNISEPKYKLLTSKQLEEVCISLSKILIVCYTDKLIWRISELVWAMGWIWLFEITLLCLCAKALELLQRPPVNKNGLIWHSQHCIEHWLIHLHRHYVDINSDCQAGLVNYTVLFKMIILQLLTALPWTSTYIKIAVGCLTFGSKRLLGQFTVYIENCKLLNSIAMAQYQKMHPDS